MIKVKCLLDLKETRTGRRRGRSDEQPSALSTPRIPRIARLMALAIRFDKMLRTGEVADLVTLAVLSHVTQPRMTQILALNLLSPDIQEELLHLPPAEVGKDPIHEKLLRPMTAEIDWKRQRQLWRHLKSTIAITRRNAR
ncbi:MAG: hypothetical protein ACKPEY_06200 [Planctomycetota bacterium]